MKSLLRNVHYVPDLEKNHVGSADFGKHVLFGDDQWQVVKDGTIYMIRRTDCSKWRFDVTIFVLYCLLCVSFHSGGVLEMIDAKSKSFLWNVFIQHYKCSDKQGSTNPITSSFVYCQGRFNNVLVL